MIRLGQGLPMQAKTIDQQTLGIKGDLFGIQPFSGVILRLPAVGIGPYDSAFDIRKAGGEAGKGPKEIGGRHAALVADAGGGGKGV